MDYDWLFVYDELYYYGPDGRLRRSIKHAGHRQNTLLLTVEPPNIKSYSRAYIRQFGWVLTSQPAWALPHSHRIYSQPALLWFYGAANGLRYNAMRAAYPDAKTKMVSTVCSSKKQWHTLHYRRYHFTQSLKRQLPELEVFGHGVRPMHDKSEALDDYKYHVAVENYIGPHHWTEKLADAFLAACLPFYAGCPNAAEYFPPESFIPIDIRNPHITAKIIRKAIEDNEYEKRLPHILRARQLVLEQYNVFAVLSREIQARHSTAAKPTTPPLLRSRKHLRRRPDIAIIDAWDKLRLRLRTLICSALDRDA